MSFGRILVIATNVFREVVRDRVLYIIGLYALILAVAIWFLPQLAATTEDKMFLDLGLAAMSLLGLIVAIFIGTGLINKEIEKRTVLVLISKPISRGEFIAGKHLGLSAVLGVLIAAMTAIYLAFMQLGNIPYPLGSVILAALFLFLQLSLITAVAIAFGVFTSSILATLLSFSVYLMGNFTQDLVTLGRLSQDVNVQRITQGLYLFLPDLSRLDLKNQAIYGTDVLPNLLTLVANAGYGLLYTGLLLAIAIFIFSRRQF